MKCANHPSVDSVAYCGQCGRPLCPECKREVGGTTYCETCLAARLRSPLASSGIAGSPGVALALGFIPGVGAIYNGQVSKAIVQVLIFGSLIGLSNHVPGPFGVIFGLGAFAFYFYMVIDSYQTARAKELGRPVEEWFGLGETNLNLSMKKPVGPALLIGLGVLFLLDNLGIPVFNSIGKFWPVLLIVVGILLLQKRASAGHSGTASNSTPPATPAPPRGPEGPNP
jgi:hypothetical protein